MQVGCNMVHGVLLLWCGSMQSCEVGFQDSESPHFDFYMGADLMYGCVGLKVL